jgi:hypothetical protein
MNTLLTHLMLFSSVAECDFSFVTAAANASAYGGNGTELRFKIVD